MKQLYLLGGAVGLALVSLGLLALSASSEETEFLTSSSKIERNKPKTSGSEDDLKIADILRRTAARKRLSGVDPFVQIVRKPVQPEIDIHHIELLGVSSRNGRTIAILEIDGKGQLEAGPSDAFEHGRVIAITKTEVQIELNGAQYALHLYEPATD